MPAIKAILEDTGLTEASVYPVHGGDINDAYCIITGTKKYSLKTNNAPGFPSMFEKEAAGLTALKNSTNLIIPAVIKYNVLNQEQYLLLEWIEKEKQTSVAAWENFGNKLAQLHQLPQSYYGWKEDNYIGSLVQANTQHNNWHNFYSECRIVPLAKQLFDKGSFTKNDIAAAESFCNKLENLFPAESPALLHGDLWSGNMMFTAAGPAIYDPAVYYGHREMDIGMSALFGGFDEQFYAAYHNTYPLEKGWQQRLPLTQLYPLLVHAVLFGGHYIRASALIVEKF
ncbi:MAG: fructosamine kinase family protein [Ferruginibacter sp.]